jgi:predicted transcriptional regulator
MTKTIIPSRTLHNVRGTRTNGNCKAVICSDNGKKWASQLDCAMELGVAQGNVSMCCSGKTRTCKGLHLHYAYDDLVDPLTERIQEQAREMENTKMTMAAKVAELIDLRTKHGSFKAAFEYKRNAKRRLENAKAAFEAAQAEYEQAKAQFEAMMDKLCEEGNGNANL